MMCGRLMILSENRIQLLTASLDQHYKLQTNYVQIINAIILTGKIFPTKVFFVAVASLLETFIGTVHHESLLSHVNSLMVGMRLGKEIFV